VLVLMGSSFLSEVYDASDQEGAPRPYQSISFAPTAAPSHSSAQRLSRQRFRALAHGGRRAALQQCVRSWGSSRPRLNAGQAAAHDPEQPSLLAMQQADAACAENW